MTPKTLRALRGAQSSSSVLRKCPRTRRLNISMEPKCCRDDKRSVSRCHIGPRLIVLPGVVTPALAGSAPAPRCRPGCIAAHRRRACHRWRRLERHRLHSACRLSLERRHPLVHHHRFRRFPRTATRSAHQRRRRGLAERCGPTSSREVVITRAVTFASRLLAPAPTLIRQTPQQSDGVSERWRFRKWQPQPPQRTARRRRAMRSPPSRRGRRRVTWLNVHVRATKSRASLPPLSRLPLPPPPPPSPSPPLSWLYALRMRPR